MDEKLKPKLGGGAQLVYRYVSGYGEYVILQLSGISKVKEVVSPVIYPVASGKIYEGP